MSQQSVIPRMVSGVPYLTLSSTNSLQVTLSWCTQHFTRALTGRNGQACFWFSNGCSIGCEECDGTTRGPGVHSNKTDFDICGKRYNATVCDPKLRTVNTDAECGSDKDAYYYSPWRAPGSAPVFDACGMAGGAPQWGHHGAQYRNTTHAMQGDKGSITLKPQFDGKPVSRLCLFLTVCCEVTGVGRLEHR